MTLVITEAAAICQKDFAVLSCDPAKCWCNAWMFSSTIETGLVAFEVHRMRNNKRGDTEIKISEERYER